MIFLDIKTLLFSNMFTNVVCLIVMIRLWQQSRPRFAGTEFLVFDFALQTAGLLLIIMRGQIPDWISFVLATTMIVAGSLLGYIGLTRFTGKQVSQIHNYIILAVFALIHVYFTFVQPSQNARNINLAAGLLIFCWQCAWLMLYRVEPGRRYLTRGVGSVFASYCALSVFRIAHAFTGTNAGNDYFNSGLSEKLVLTIYQTLFVLLTYSLMLMINKFLFRDVKIEEKKFSKAFHSAPYAMMITRLSDGKVIEVNEGFSMITGYQQEEVRGKTTPDLHLWDRDEDRAVAVNDLANEGRIQEREFQFRKKSGEMMTGLFSAETIMINNENCVLSSINDITERKKAESQREAALGEVHRLNENLEQKVRERTAELQKIITQLEETNRVFVGRELKMAELKERISVLEGKRK